MSRIILSKHSDGGEHVTVGWDHPAGGAFWQEWASPEEVREAMALLEKDEESAPYQTVMMVETGVKREGGMWPGIPLEALAESMPEELRPLLAPRVMDLLAEHQRDSDSGYNARPIDLTRS